MRRVVRRRLCLQQFTTGQGVGQRMVRGVDRQAVALAAVGQADGQRAAAAQAIPPADAALGIQARFQLHGVDDREGQPFTQMLAQRLVEEVAFDLAVVRHHHLAGQGFEQLVEYVCQAGAWRMSEWVMW